MIKKLICISCPRGCNLEVDTSTLSVKGNSCPRGIEYGKNEVTNPKRTITSTVIINNGEIDRLSIKSDKPINKDLIFKAMEEINKVKVNAPIKVGDIIIKNILNTDVNIIATKNVGKK